MENTKPISFKVGCNFDCELVSGLAALNERYPDKPWRITELYGSVPSVNPIGNARPDWRLQDLSRDGLVAFSEVAQANGFGLNYTLNTSSVDPRNLNCKLDEVKEFLRYLHDDVNVLRVTVAHPLVAQVVQDESDLPIELSTILQIRHPRQLEEFKRRYPRIEKLCIDVPAGTIVETPGGAKKIEDLREGEYVLSGKGDITTVSHCLKRRYSGVMVKIRAQGLGDPVVCTADHPIAVMRGNGKIDSKPRRWLPRLATGPEWVKASEIEVGDFVLTPTFHRFSRCMPVELEEDLKLIEEMPEFFGLYVAEGHALPEDGHIGISLGDDETELQELATRSLEKLGCATVGPHATSERGLQITGCSKDLAAKLVRLCGRYSENKHIPYVAMEYATDSTLTRIVDGYMAGDGSVGKYGVEYTGFVTTASTTSFELTHQLRRVVQALGGKPILRPVEEYTDESGVHHQRSYYLKWIPTSDDTWMPSGAGRNYTARIQDGVRRESEAITGEYVWMPVTSVKHYEDSTVVYNLTCGPTNTFVAGGIAVHNCVYECCDRNQCYDLHALNLSVEAVKLFRKYPMGNCVASRIRDPREWLMARFILPQWIEQYHRRFNIESFKITGRTHPTPYILRTTETYMSGSYTGNLLELWADVEYLGKLASEHRAPRVYLDCAKLSPDFLEFYFSRAYFGALDEAKYIDEVYQSILR
jgi:hypothetical protein